MLDDEGIRRTLVGRGLRLTRQRESILDAVSHARGSFTAQQLHDVLRAHEPGIGLTTVYRTLEILAEVGAVERIHGLSHCEAFVAAGAGHSHTIVCSVCGSASELTDCGCEDLVATAAVQTGFRIDDHVIQLSGICARCVAEAGATEARPGGSAGRAGDDAS